MTNLYLKTNSTLRILSKKLGFFDERFLTNWSDIVGSDMAQNCTPYKMTCSTLSNKKTLILITSNLHFKATFTYQKQDILNKIKFYFGVNIIENVKIITKQ